MIKSYIKKNIKIFLFLSMLLFICPAIIFADDNLANRLSGKIILQVESRGEAWYVNPNDLKRYYLGRPQDAFSVMSDLGIGITDNDLEKFPIGLNTKIYNGPDTDNDGLSDELEKIIKSDPLKTDTDNDGYNDKLEIINGYNPIGLNKLPINGFFAKKNAGKIFLQVESRGEAWYINPGDNSRYFLGRPTDAYHIMRAFGLGITTVNLLKIEEFKKSEPPIINNDIPIKAEDVIKNAAEAIRKKDKSKIVSYFTPEMKKSVEYNIDNMSNESIFALGNILSGSKLSSSTDTEKIYTNEVYFPLGGYDVLIKFYVKKQPDGKWLMTNL
jgi:hypothetical protein